MEFICKKSKPGHYSAKQWGGGGAGGTVSNY